MRTSILAAMALALAAPLSAQQWTAEQQEVITQLEECWDIWVGALNEGRPDAWLDRCTDDFRYWGDEVGAPNGSADARRTWTEVMEADEYWVSLKPLDIRVVGDVAIMHFYGSWNGREGDERVTLERKRTEVFRNVNGRWLLIAGHSQPTGN
jgi:ketosteroid isomerase-like protein